MAKRNYIKLNYRSLISVKGDDANTFLQGLVSNDINKIDDEGCIYALMLTPQGKFLYDFFIVKDESAYYIDCFNDSKEAILKKLKTYKLRSKVQIEDLSNKYEIVALSKDYVTEKLYEKNSKTYKFCKGLIYLDPRCDEMFARSFIEKENNCQSFTSHDFTETDIDEYHSLRIDLKIPEGHFDIESEKAFPHDFDMNNYNCIDYNKGCYVGQEVTARVEYKGKNKKSLYRVEIAQNSQLPTKSEITQNSKKVGFLCSNHSNKGLAILDNNMIEKSRDNLEINSIAVRII